MIMAGGLLTTTAAGPQLNPSYHRDAPSWYSRQGEWGGDRKQQQKQKHTDSRWEYQLNGTSWLWLNRDNVEVDYIGGDERQGLSSNVVLKGMLMERELEIKSQ